MLNATGYVRVSTENQAREGWSLDAQREKIELYCRLHDLALSEIIADEGISACNVKSRPGMMCLIEMTRSKKSPVQVIVTTKLDRLFRNAAEALKYSEMWRKRNIALHSITEGVQSDGATGKMFFNLLAVFAEFERDQTSERTKAGLARRKAQGLKLGGECPYGFQADSKGQMKWNESEKKVIYVIKALRAKGYSLKKIADHLNARGYRTRRDTLWRIEYIHNVLKIWGR